MMDGWRWRAEELADRLVERGDIRRRVWREAFASVPRHVFVPAFFRDDPGMGWTSVADGDPGYQDAVYGTDFLITQLSGEIDACRHRSEDRAPVATAWPSSSSSSPAVMAQMLEALDVRDGSTVLEIGTGTGYNAGLLAYRLGDRNVASVDVDAGLVATAGERLGLAGFFPPVVVADAMSAIPSGRFDRIVATVAVPRVPTRWTAAVPPGGTIMVNLASWLSSDLMFLLRVDASGVARGMPLPERFSFMSARDADGAASFPPPAALDLRGGELMRSNLPLSVLDDQYHGFRAFLTLRLRDVQRFQLVDDPAGGGIIGADGSWVRDLGDGTVEQGGPRRIWSIVESLWEWWTAAGRPDRSRLGLTVQPDGQHAFFVDDSENELDWPWP